METNDKCTKLFINFIHINVVPIQKNFQREIAWISDLEAYLKSNIRNITICRTDDFSGKTLNNKYKMTGRMQTNYVLFFRISYAKK